METPSQQTNESVTSSLPEKELTPITPLLDNKNEHNSPKKSRVLFWWLFGGVFVIISILIILVFFLPHIGTQRESTAYKATYVFVPSELSKSSRIPVVVPANIRVQDISSQVTFTPELEGNWIIYEDELAVDREQIYYFQPQNDMLIGDHITVALETDTGILSGSFLVTNNPEVQAIFPSTGTEVHEATPITIVFNRPMVPVTTLNQQEVTDIPIRIEPETPGHFKWISTRNLQFIPETTLRPSATYVVHVPALRSLDGVTTNSFRHHFSTRRLQYESVTTGSMNFNEPIRVTFNMPVDKDRTKNQLTVQTTNGTRIPVEVEYGKITRRTPQGERETLTDQRVLEIYPVRDSHGRLRVWDFDTAYELEIREAHALFGVNSLSQRRAERILVPNIVRDVRAESDRSHHVTKDLFDPTGELIIELYDEVSLDASDIAIDGLSSISYGERCREDDDVQHWMRNVPCERETDKRILHLTFDLKEFSPSDVLTLDLNSLVAPNGFLYNQQPISETITIFPEFSITRVIENHQRNAGAVDHIHLCSTTPLQDPKEEGIGSYITTSERIVFGRWQNSRLITERMHNPICPVGNFQTRINYGLLPETAYQLTITPTDQFGQRTATYANFITEQVTNRDTRFHHLQKQYSVTTPDVTTLTFATENMTYINMHVCETTPEQFLQFVADRPSNTTGVQRTICTSERQERIELPNRYWELNYFQVDLSDYTENIIGNYILTFYHPNHQTGFGANREQHFERSYVSVTDISFAKKELIYNPSILRESLHPRADGFHAQTVTEQPNLYWVVDSESLAPIQGTTVTQFRKINGQVRSGNSAMTDHEGIARPNAEAEVVGAVVRSGNRTAVVANWADMLQNRQVSQSTARTYVYTDRPIYRPGHTVHVKGIDRIGFDGEFETVTGESVTVAIHNSRNEEIYSAELFISTYGTFDTTIDLPHDAPLGRYQIHAFDQISTFQVEEYEGSPFRLTATTEYDEYINGDEVVMHIDAEYYFGAPVQSGSVSYSVVSQQYFFDRYQDAFFSFGSRWYFCYTCWFNDQFLYRGEVELDSNGQAEIRERFNLDNLFPNEEETASRLITYQITATDSNGRSVSTQQSFIVHYSDTYVGVQTDPFFTRTNEPITLSMKTVDIQGDSVQRHNIDYTVYHVTWDTFRRQEVDGGFYFRSEKNLHEVMSDTVSSDKSGNFTKQIEVGKTGSYEVHVSYTDERDNAQLSIARFFARGAGSISVPRNNNYTLDMSVTQPELSIGDTGSVLITTPHPEARALITTERGQIFTHEVVDITGGLYVHEFPVADDYVPNVYVTAVLHSTEPTVQFNSVEFFIDRTKQRVGVDLTTNKSSYNPGDEVTLDITTHTSTGEPVSAEVSVAVADLSVLALVGNPKKDPLQFFYSGFPHTISTASNLKNILHEVDVPDGTKGGDGVNPEDLALQPRGDFRDTAFWNASVVTDENGKATVTFTLPDNLTTWQIEAVAVTEDTRLGTGYNEFTSRKDIMVQPLAPRFFVSGDTVYIGAQVFNQTDNTEKFTITFNSQSLQNTDSNEKTVRIGGGDSKTVFFRTKVPDDWQNNHSITISAQGGGYADSVIRTIPMKQARIHESVATAGVVSSGEVTEYLFVPGSIANDRGTIGVTTASTLRGFFTPIEEYIAHTEQSRWYLQNLYQIATLAHVYDIQDVDPQMKQVTIAKQEKTLQQAIATIIDEVKQSQRFDGGFAYSFQTRSSVPLTTSIVPVLLDLRDLGYEIDESIIRSALQFIEQQINQHQPNIPYRTDLALKYVYNIQRLGETSNNSFVNGLLNNMHGNKQTSDLTNAELLQITQLPKGHYISDQHLDRIYNQLRNRVIQTGRGAVLRDPQQPANHFRVSEQIRQSAYMIRVFLDEDIQFPLLHEMAQWLIAVRDNEQRWYSDELTYHVVRSLHAYMNKTENIDNTSGSIAINKSGSSWFTHEFSPAQTMQTSNISLGKISSNTILPIHLTRSPKGTLYYDLLMQYMLPTNNIPPRDEGITITRNLRHLGKNSLGSEIKRGEIVVGELTITIPDSGHDMTLSAPVPAGFTLVNLNFATEDQDIINRDIMGATKSGTGLLHRLRRKTNDQVAMISGLGADTREFIPPQHRRLPIQREELTDSSVEIYVSNLLAGVYQYYYFMRAQTPGTYLHLPAEASLVQFPEIFGRTPTGNVNITQ